MVRTESRPAPNANEIEMLNTHLILDVGGVLVMNNWEAILSEFALKIRQPENLLQGIVQEYFDCFMLGEHVDPGVFLARKQIKWLSPKDLIDFRTRVGESEHLNWELINNLLCLRGCEYSLLTNNHKDVQMVLHQKLGMPKFYRHLINSSQCGILKPDPRIYMYALAVLRTEPEKCIFVDDFADNVEAAMKVGMRGIVYYGINNFRKELSKSMRGR